MSALYSIQLLSVLKHLVIGQFSLFIFFSLLFIGNHQLAKLEWLRYPWLRLQNPKTFHWSPSIGKLLVWLWQPQSRPQNHTRYADESYPSGHLVPKWRRINVVASTLIRRHFRTKCPLGTWFAHRVTSWVVHLPYRLMWVGLITASDQILWAVHSCNSWLWCYIYLCPTTNLQNFVNIYYVPTCLSY